MAHRCNLAMQTFSNLPLVENIETLLQSMYVFLNSLFEEAHGTWEVGRNFVNKRSKDPLLCQNLVNLHAYTCQMGFGWVKISCHEDMWWPCCEYNCKNKLWIVVIATWFWTRLLCAHVEGDAKLVQGSIRQRYIYMWNCDLYQYHYCWSIYNVYGRIEKVWSPLVLYFQWLDVYNRDVFHRCGIWSHKLRWICCILIQQPFFNPT